MSDLKDALDRARGGGPERHHEKSRDQGKMPVRDRVARLVDADSFVEDALLANWEQEGFGADGVVTGMATIGGRPVALMANDPTVKAGSWGPKTVEKIIRIQEQALEHLVPMVYLVDSAGARITDQVQMFPGRRGARPEQHAAALLGLVRDDAYRAPVEPRIAHDQLLRPAHMHLEERVGVHEGIEQLAHVERLVLVRGDLGEPGRGLGRRRHGWLLAPVRAEVGQVGLREIDPLLV